MVEHYDFCGYATKNDLLCSDGRTIRKNAFADCDGKVVPLVWNHRHDDPEMVLGHALLENRDDGVYMYGKFNDTERGRTCKKILENRDLHGLSIHATGLKQRVGDVLHGVIKEVSLVLSGANPGAVIDFAMSQGEGEEDEVYAYLIGDEYTQLKHEGVEVDLPDPVNETEGTEEENDMAKHDEFEHADKEDSKKKESENDEKDDEDETVEDVFNTLSEKQKTAVYSLLNAVSERSKGTKDEDDEEEKEMKHNAFEEYEETRGNVLSHADMEVIFRDAKKLGSLKDAVAEHRENGVLMHADEDYGITRGTGTNEYFVRDPEMLFPDYRAVSNTPEFIKRDTNWVTEFMSAVKHTPFSRIKTMFADITIDDARALGYVKGNQKRNEFFNLIKRTTDPQTVYKHQKMDRDDVVDIVDFDVVAWIKAEMRDRLEEEIARACLISDGRDASSSDKISEDHVRSVLNDHDLFTIKTSVENSDATSVVAKAFVKEAIHIRKDYKGSGNPILFVSDTMLADLLTTEDGNGRYIYETEQQLMTAMRVRKIVSVPLFESTTFTDADGDTCNLAGIILNPIDYTIGADKGGAINMFDDFDIDYNQMKYLIETRISGCLVKPKSAIVIGVKAA